jgi:hypothetical protein
MKEINKNNWTKKNNVKGVAFIIHKDRTNKKENVCSTLDT